MKKLIILFGMVIIFSSQAYSQTGNDLYTWYLSSLKVEEGKNITAVELTETAAYKGYINGVLQTLDAFGIFNMPDNFKMGQAHNIIGIFLINHPEERHGYYMDIIIMAMLEAYQERWNIKRLALIQITQMEREGKVKKK